MHGSLFYGFKQFLVARDGQEGWNAIVRDAGAAGWYVATETYPDEELVALVRAAAVRLGIPAAEVLEQFGSAIVPVLLGLYGSFVDPRWRTLDLLVNTESVIHRTIRLRDRQAAPPRLRAQRLSAREVQIEYDSERRLCAVAIGICRGVAAHYGEKVIVDEPECMARGAPACRLIVRLTSD